MVKLSKEICKECWNKHSANNEWLCWHDGYDDELWQSGYMWCRLDVCSLSSIRVDEVRDGCSYKLEHIVLGNKPK